MEYTLRCNSTSCRRHLNDRAVVTTCSHIFCLDCSAQLQLSRHQPGRHPVCPACDSQLPNPDDVVNTNLNPTEDYKTSVLSGLSPQVIIECAGRALSFWAYQSTQEIVYNEFISKTLSDKYGALNIQLDKIINDANAEVTNLRDQITNLQVEQQQIGRKNDELTQSLRERTRKHLHVQELYDKLKRRSMLGQVKDAACEAVEDTIQASVAINRHMNVPNDSNMRPPAPPLFHNGSASTVHNSGYANMPGSGFPTGLPVRGSGAGGWTSFGEPTSSHNQPVQTPSHRQRLTPNHGLVNGIESMQNLRPNAVSQIHPLQSRSTPRQALAQVSGNSGLSGFAGYGMSAGLKISNPPGSASGIRPVTLSRVAQRPPSGFAGRPGPIFTTGNANMFSNPNNNIH